MEDRLLTVDEVAELLRLKKTTIFQLVFYRRIPFIKLSRRCLRFRKSDIERWINSHRKEQAENPSLRIAPSQKRSSGKDSEEVTKKEAVES